MPIIMPIMPIITMIMPIIMMIMIMIMIIIMIVIMMAVYSSLTDKRPTVERNGFFFSMSLTLEALVEGF